VDIKADVVEAIKCQFEMDLNDGQRPPGNDRNSGASSASQHSEEYPSGGNTSLPTTGATSGDLVAGSIADSCPLGEVSFIEEEPTCLEMHFIAKNVKLRCAVGDLGTCKTDAVVVLIDSSGKTGNTGKAVIGRMSENMRKNYQIEVDMRLKYKNPSQGSVFSTGGGQTDIKQIFHVVLNKNFVSQSKEKRKDLMKAAYTKIFTDLFDSLDAETLTMSVYGVGEYTRIQLVKEHKLDNFITCNNGE